MSIGRGTSDLIRCDVRSCREKYFAGSAALSIAVPTDRALAEAAEHGWSVLQRHLCPKHAYLANRTVA